jgi:hypothetical protein
MVRLGKSIHEIEDLITGYPAVTEGLLECVRMLNNTSIMKPHAFNKNLLRVESVSYHQEGHPVFKESFENEKGNKTSKPNRIHGL